MPRYLTEQDIRDAAAGGTAQLILEPDMRLTPMAQDVARQLGLVIVHSTNTAAETGALAPKAIPSKPDLHATIRAAVIARLGTEPDDLDAIIAGILDGLEEMG